MTINNGKRDVKGDKPDFPSAVLSDVCACGLPKQKLQSVCRTCWFRLPRPLALDLWLPLEDGFVRAYSAARAWLKANPSRSAVALPEQSQEQPQPVIADPGHQRRLF